MKVGNYKKPQRWNRPTCNQTKRYKIRYTGKVGGLTIIASYKTRVDTRSEHGSKSDVALRRRAITVKSRFTPGRSYAFVKYILLFQKKICISVCRCAF